MFGGTFDPVHLGHLRSAVEVREVLELDRLHMIPAPQPPLRDRPQVAPLTRLELLEAGIGDTPGLVADGRELERSGPSYTVDTLKELRQEYGDEARLVMVVGLDAFLRLGQWRDPQRLFELAHVVVLDRPDSPQHSHAPLPDAPWELLGDREVDSVAKLMQRPGGGLLHLRLPSRMAISATEIRRRLASGLSVRYLLAEAVERRIQAKHLYRG
ncbi:nicotinate-nucleotide adenylyltransferase [Halomonas sp. Bachu 37]|uniref:nicotinate-nucleotide adenylyltransferase n=1 Tax=Halomonas kashgarensis TaxID=3084920 RepID=UPI0032171A6B